MQRKPSAPSPQRASGERDEMAINISPLEVLVLKKLVLVNHALGTKLDGQAGREQKALVHVLNDITLRADLDNHTQPQPESDTGGKT